MPQDIEAIVLEFEKLLSDMLDAMPRLRPVLGCLLSEHRHAIHRDANRVQHRMVDEGRTLAAKARRHHEDGPEMLCGQKVADLIGGIETDGFDGLDGYELQILQPRHPGHYFRNALGYGTEARGIPPGLRG